MIVGLKFDKEKVLDVDVSGEWDGERLVLNGVKTYALFEKIMNALRTRPTNGVSKANGKPEEEPPPPPPAEQPPTDDLGIFGRMTTFGEVVDEVLKRGVGDFDAVLAYVNKVKDAEVCPMLDRSDLEDKLRTICVKKNVAGAL